MGHMTRKDAEAVLRLVGNGVWGRRKSKGGELPCLSQIRSHRPKEKGGQDERGLASSFGKTWYNEIVKRARRTQNIRTYMKAFKRRESRLPVIWTKSRP